MNRPELDCLERFAARQLSGKKSDCVVWMSEAANAGQDIESLVRLVPEYGQLPLRWRNYSFILTPTAIVISRSAPT